MWKNRFKPKELSDSCIKGHLPDRSPLGGATPTSSIGSPRDSESSVENDREELAAGLGERGAGRVSRVGGRDLLPLPVRRSSVVLSPAALSPVNSR